MAGSREAQLGLPYEAGEAWRYVRHPRARRYRLRVDADGGVRITIPRGGSRRAAEAFARRHRAWIEEHVGRRRAAGAGLPAAARAALRQRAAVSLVARAHALAGTLGLAPARVSVGDQRTRWGSCGPTGHIRLNWRLVLVPRWVRDYVLVHELMHLRRPDHSPAFWALVAAACPRYQEARRWLRAEGGTLA